MIVIQEPERELSAAFVEIAAPTVEEAIAQAWKRWRPDFARTVRATAKPPATSGWDEVAQIAYETGAEERRVVVGAARRKGQTYYVTLIDGAVAAAERRGAQLNIAVGSLEVASRTEENLAGRRAHTLDPARLEKLVAFAEAARKQTNVPGVALAVVQDGKIVLEKGLGVRELGTNEPVTPSTMFMIGSMTKPLTSLMMARLVDSKKFTWDTPITKLMPAFALGDPDATSRVTMAHTVCACTGLPRWDMEFIFESTGIDAGVAHRAGARDEADDRLRRDLPVQQPDGGLGWLRRRDDGNGSEGSPARLRGRDDRGGARSARHDVDRARPRCRAEARARAAARPHADLRVAGDPHRVRAWGRFRDARRRRLVNGGRHLPLAARRAGQRQTRWQAGRQRSEHSRATQAAREDQRQAGVRPRALHRRVGAGSPPSATAGTRSASAPTPPSSPSTASGSSC